MGKFSKKFKRQLKKAGRAVDKVVSMPVRVVRATVEGKSSTTILKEVGRGIGGAAQLSLITSGDGQKILSSDKLNRATFGITKELRNVGQGFNAMSKRETVDSSFYKSGLSLAAKAAVGYGAYSYFAAAPAASSGAGAIEVTSQTAVAGSSAGTTAGAVTSTNVATGAGIKGAALTAGKYATYGVLAKKILSGDAKLADVAESFIPGSGELFGGSDKNNGGGSEAAPVQYADEKTSTAPVLLALGAVGLFVLAKK